MFLLRLAKKNCIKHKKKTILNLLICMTAILLLNAYIGNIAKIRKQLTELPSVIKVNAVISNLCGTLDASLKIEEKYIDGIMASEYVTDPVFTAQFKTGMGEFDADQAIGRLNYYAVGTNSIAGIPGLLPNELTFEPGMNENTFFSSTDRICVMDKYVMKEHQLSVGDVITQSVFYFRYGDYHEIFIEPLDTELYRIVGTIDMNNYIGNNIQPDVIFPFSTMRNIFHEKKLEFCADSGAFQVKDPFLLNELKSDMHEIGFLPVISWAEFQYDGIGLTIKDETFVQLTEQLIKNKGLMEGLLPFLGFVIFAVGYVLAELFMKERRGEYAIMRSLGQKHTYSLGILITEYGMTALFGCILGGILSILFLNTNWHITIYVAAVFLFCYIIGEITALSSLRKMSVMSVLSKND